MGDKETLQDLWTRAADRRSKAEPLRGLIVVADRTGANICVQFGRQGRAPSGLEINICLAHLPVPPSVNPISEPPRNGYHIVTYTWPNPTPAQPPLAVELAPIVIPKRADGEDKSYAAQFERFNAANPHVLAALESLALQLYRAGVRGYGVKALVERLRWDYAIATASADGFKLNNNLTSRYARALVARRPELADLFELRALKRS